MRLIKVICVHLCSSVVAFLYTFTLHAASLQDFTTSESAILIVSAENGRTLAAANEQLLNRTYPTGSLAKIFTVIAYHQTSGKDFPVFSCPPTLPSDRNGCWDRNGHGEVDIVKAIGYSCNVYFTQLAKRTSPEAFRKTLKMFDLPPVNSNDHIQDVMIGKSLQWIVSPAVLLRAYTSFFNGGYLYPHRTLAAKHALIDASLLQIIHQGMKHSADQGTSTEAAKVSGQSLIGKTGTSYLWTDGKVSWRETQGWWIGLHPAEKPRVAVLTFVRKGRGATDAAPLGGKALKWYLQHQ